MSLASRSACVIRFAGLCALAVLLCDSASAPAQKKQAGWTTDRTMSVRQIPQVHAAPDGQRVAYVVRQAVMDAKRSEYLSHIHVAKSDGSEAVQLTQGDKSCDNPQWSPDGEQIGFLSNRSGKKNVWAIRAKGGEAEQVTESKTGVSSFKWSPDGKAIAYVAVDGPTPQEEKATKEKNDAWVVDENIRQNRLHVVVLEKDAKGKRASRLLTSGNYNVGSGIWLTGYDWSPDSRSIAFTQTKTPKPDDWGSADIAVADVAKATVQPLVKTPAAESAPHFSPDGKWVAYVASDNPPTWGVNYTVHVMPAAGGSSRALAETFDKWPHLVGWAQDGKKIYYTETRGTRTQLFALPLDGAPLEISKNEGVLSAISLNHGRNTFGFAQETASRPPEAYVSLVEKFVPTQISKVNAEVAAGPVPRTDVIRWKAKDDVEIEGLLTYPAGYAQRKRYPLLLVIHGGPMGVFTERYVGSSAGLYPVAVFADRGYAVLRCNIRGSSGYGQKFRYANYGDWGGKDFQDLMAGVDHVVALGVADSERLGVMGWSYGGFMTSWTITQTKRFKAASVGAGVTNLMSFTGTADIPGFLPDYFAGEFWDKLDAYRNHSAMFQVKGVTTPTLIQHGEKDLRVPISQGYELYNALKRQGCVTKMVVYPRTPHGPEEPKLLLDVMNRNVEWFDRYVRSEKK